MAENTMRTVAVEAKNALLIVLGIFSAAFGLKGFLLSSRFIDGGVTGISMLFSEVLDFPLAVLLLLINLPFIAIGYRQIGKLFAAKSALAIAGLSLCLFFVEFPDVTPDKLLTAVFGGLFIGAGIGLAIRGGSVLDGTEIAALLVSRKSHLLRVGDVILILNVFIFLAAAFFLGVESAMYSILTYVAASKTIEFLLHGVEEYTAITIISPKSEEIKQAIMSQLKRGVTVIRGQGGMGSTGVIEDERQILYCVITRLEIGKVKSVAIDIDDQAFITTHTLSDVQGGLLKHPALH
ncbi:MAG TPA: YitT family protein [Pyrinomonadaceae bacterium]|nr:YitT family protein [Pyrinomonadaceae bacterium]